MFRPFSRNFLQLDLTLPDGNPRPPPPPSPAHRLPGAAPFVPLPQGLYGLQKAARKLKIEYANAVTDFEWYVGGRCAPCINGIIVHLRDEDQLRYAYCRRPLPPLSCREPRREHAARVPRHVVLSVMSSVAALLVVIRLPTPTLYGGAKER